MFLFILASQPNAQNDIEQTNGALPPDVIDTGSNNFPFGRWSSLFS
jgi:hypothetical protein